MKILIVDDNRLFGKHLAQFTRRCGHETETACCMEGAKEYMSMVDYDLCFIETHLQNEKGFDLLNHVKQHYPDTFTVPMTKSTKEGFFSHNVVDNEDRLLVKPIKLESIKKLMIKLNGIKSVEELQSIESY